MSVWVVTAVGLSITCLLIALISASRHELTLQNFDNSSHKLTNEISRNISSSMRAIYHLVSYYQGSEHVTYNEFNKYVRGFIRQYPEIHAMEWVPRIPHSQRDEHEKRQSFFIQGYQITEMHKENGMIRAADRDYYYPVSYVYPFKGNENAFGYDLASNPERSVMLKTAALTNEITASSAIRLVQEKGDSKAFLITLPVSKSDKIIRTLDNPYIEGFVLGVFRISPILDKFIDYLDFQHVYIEITETNDKGVKNLIYYHYPEAKKPGLLNYSTSIMVADREWDVTIHADPVLYGAYSYYDYILMLGIGMGFTLLLAAYINHIRDNHRKAQEISDQLIHEIDMRRKSEQKLITSNNKLEVLSREDPVMKIANRRAFNEYLMSEWKRARRTGFPLSLIIADIDDFKLYNDKYGHVVGDHCLRNIAKLFSKVANRSSDLAARYGGEELAVVLPETFESGATALAENLCKSVAELYIPHEKSNVCSVVTISVGVTTISDVANYSIDEIIKTADAALYLAKEQGKNRVVHLSPNEQVLSSTHRKKAGVKHINIAKHVGNK